MFYAIIFFAIIFADQLSKALIDANNVKVEIIKGVFSISNVRNHGAAFSMLHDVSWAQTFFFIATIIIMLGLCAYLIFTKSQSKFFKVSVVMIMGGAMGNFIDRVAFSYVRDFIYPHFFANFNIADIFVCVGAFLLAVYYLFIDKDAIFRKKKDENQ